MRLLLLFNTFESLCPEKAVPRKEGVCSQYLSMACSMMDETMKPFVGSDGGPYQFVINGMGTYNICGPLSYVSIKLSGADGLAGSHVHCFATGSAAPHTDHLPNTSSVSFR